jgi:hypothetical protein
VVRRAAEHHTTSKLRQTPPLTQQPRARASSSAPPNLSLPTHPQLLLAALGACAGLLALSAAFPRPTARRDERDDAERATLRDQQQRRLADALDREARAATSGALWGLEAPPTKQQGSTRGAEPSDQR